MTDQPHLDEEALAELQDVMEDEFELLIQTFLADSRSHIGALQKALSQSDADQLTRTAHSFKGSCINMGALRLSELCFQVEQSGKSGDLRAIATLLEQVEKEFLEVVHRLGHFLTL